MLDSGPCKIEVYFGNIYIMKDIKGLPKKKYASYEDVVADGWQVD